jgi:hypothetical protein
VQAADAAGVFRQPRRRLTDSERSLIRRAIDAERRRRNLLTGDGSRRRRAAQSLADRCLNLTNDPLLALDLALDVWLADRQAQTG